MISTHDDRRDVVLGPVEAEVGQERAALQNVVDLFCVGAQNDDVMNAARELWGDDGSSPTSDIYTHFFFRA